MKILFSLIKYAFLCSLIYLLTMLFASITLTLAHPILPDSIIAAITNNSIGILHIRKTGSPLEALLQLVFISSFFIVAFTIFKTKTFATKLIASSVLMVTIFISLARIKNQYLTAGFAIILILSAFILIFRKIIKRGKTNKQKSPKFKSNRKTKNDTGLVFDTKYGSIHLENPFRGIYVQGGAGSGKSVSLFEPIIKQIAEKEFTGLLYDFKSPELAEKLLYSYKNNSKVETYFIDFKNPYISNRCNPISPKYMPKTVHALEFSTVLLNNMLPETIKKGFDFWSGGAKAILAGTMIYLKNNHPLYCTLPHTIALLLLTDSDKLINEIANDDEAGGLVTSLKQAIDRDAEKMVAGVLSTLQNALSQLYSADIFWILSGNDFSLELNDPNDPKMLAIGNDSTLASTYAPIISLIISSAVKQMNQPNKQQSMVLLDEAPTIFIPNIESLPATARSNKVSVVFGVQDYSQLADKYGKDKAEVIISNMGNQFYGRTVNVDSAKRVKDLFGKEDKIFMTKNIGSGSSGQFVHLSTNTNRGSSESIQERDRITTKEITNLVAGQFCGVIAEGTPKDFLSTQFKTSSIDGEYKFEKITTEEKIKDNYYKIIEEAKSIVL